MTENLRLQTLRLHTENLIQCPMNAMSMCYDEVMQLDLYFYRIGIINITATGCP